MQQQPVKNDVGKNFFLLFTGDVSIHSECDLCRTYAGFGLGSSDVSGELLSALLAGLLKGDESLSLEENGAATTNVCRMPLLFAFGGCLCKISNIFT